MTPDQFRTLRESRNETRAELGEILGVTAGAIVQWERGTRSIPKWAAEKMLKTVDVTLPLADLSLLLEEAARQKLNFSDYLSKIIRSHLGTATASNIESLAAHTAMVAEEANGTYEAGKQPAASPAQPAPQDVPE